MTQYFEELGERPLALAALQNLPIENNNRFLRGGNIFDCLLKKSRTF